MRHKLFPIAVLFAIAVALTGVSVADAQTAEDPAKVSAGMDVYSSSCAGCHAADGSGVDGRGRPLIGVAGQEPDRTVHISSVTDGKGGMPEFGTKLSADEIDNAVAYVRATFVAEETEALPRTGTESNVLLVSGAMLVGLGAIVLTSRRRRDTAAV